MSKLKSILEVFKASKGEITPHSLITGPTGSGKTYTVEEECKAQKINFIPMNASQLTTEGVSGSSLSRLFAPLIHIKTPVVVFLDEFDKLIIDSSDASKENFTRGVQDELLKVIESGTVHVLMDYGKYGTVKNNKILFLLAGAFNDLEIDEEEDSIIDILLSKGLTTQFLGRVPIHIHMNKIPLRVLERILKESELLHYYCNYFNVNKELIFKSLQKKLIAEYEGNLLGVRIVNKLIHNYFL